MQLDAVDIHGVLAVKAGVASPSGDPTTDFAAILETLRGNLAPDSTIAPDRTEQTGPTVPAEEQPNLPEAQADGTRLVVFDLPVLADTGQGADPKDLSMKQKLVAQQVRFGLLSVPIQSGSDALPLPLPVNALSNNQAEPLDTPKPVSAATLQVADTTSGMPFDGSDAIMQEDQRFNHESAVDVPKIAGHSVDRPERPLQILGQVDNASSGPRVFVHDIQGPKDVSDKVKAVPRPELSEAGVSSPTPVLSHRPNSEATLAILPAMRISLGHKMTEEAQIPLDTADPTSPLGPERAISDAAQGIVQSRGHGLHPTARLDPVAATLLRDAALAAANNATRLIELDTGIDVLGKISLSIQSQDGTLMVTLLSGRPEALDLLRRTIGVFLRDLADQGFSDVDLHLGPRSDGAERLQSNRSWPLGTSVTTTAQGAKAAATGHFDKRL